MGPLSGQISDWNLLFFVQIEYFGKLYNMGHFQTKEYSCCKNTEKNY